MPPEKISVEAEVAGTQLSLTTGEWARQAGGSVLVRYGDTVVFVAAVVGDPRPGIDFFPLTVDYRERMAAAGKFAGGFLKREGRPSTKEVLTSRLTDRPIRPLFPKWFKGEVQVMCNVMAFDGENDPDILAIIGASAALKLTGAPFSGPVASVRVGRVEGELVAMPTVSEMEVSDLDLVVAGNAESVLMIEGFGRQIPEAEMTDAILFAHGQIKELCKLQNDFIKKADPQPMDIEAPGENPFVATIEKDAYSRIKDAKQNSVKQERHSAVGAIKDELQEKYFPEGADEAANGGTPAQFSDAFYQAERRAVRDLILDGKRLDGRTSTDLREVWCQVGVLPRVHGSAVFTRGETQSLATVTLGTSRDQQRFDTLFGEEGTQRFMLHYYFPPYCVGEIRPIRGPGRREIGHGCLAERSVEPVMPTESRFPYTIRCISDIMESNGSSSMASVCGATLSLMDAGVPIKQPVAGVSIGLVKDAEDKYTILTDIMGDEDHYGDMDFKVAGTQKGITGIQLDLKIDGISEKIIRETLEQAKKARIDLLKSMLGTIPRPRADISSYAPRLTQIKIDPAKIGLVIGPGGKSIRAIQDETGAQVDIDDNGTVTVSARNTEMADKAIARIEAMTEEIRVGRIYTGTVSAIKDFGAFVEIAPGKDGLVHISELSHDFVRSVSDVCKPGDKMTVKVIDVDAQNRVKLSRKALLDEPEATEDEGDDDFEE